MVVGIQAQRLAQFTSTPSEQLCDQVADGAARGRDTGEEIPIVGEQRPVDGFADQVQVLAPVDQVHAMTFHLEGRPLACDGGGGDGARRLRASAARDAPSSSETASSSSPSGTSAPSMLNLTFAAPMRSAITDCTLASGCFAGHEARQAGRANRSHPPRATHKTQGS